MRGYGIYLSIIVFFALYIAQQIGILKRIKFLAKEEETPKGNLVLHSRDKVGDLGGIGEGIERELDKERRKMGIKHESTKHVL